jgi:hypothetical protein
MPEPYNYTLQIPSMFERISQLQNINAQDEQLKAFQQDREMKLAAQNLAMDQQRKQNALIENLMRNPNPTVRDFSMVSMLMPKDRAEAIQKSSEAMDADTKKNQLLFGGQVMSALTAGKPDIAMKMLDEKATSESNAGRDGNLWKTYSQLIGVDPDKGLKTFGVMIASVPGGDKVLESALKAQKGPSDVAKSESDAEKAKVEAEFAPQVAQAGLESTRATTKNTLNQITDRANRLGLDKDKLSSEMQLKIEEMNRKGTDLDPDAKKIINTAMADSAVAMQYSGKLNDLAARVLQAGGGSGGGTTIAQYFKNVFGKQSEWDQIRNEYVRIKNIQALKNLPPGPASDRDIKTAKEGLPPEGANADYIASFLRGMAKLSSIDSSIKAAEADWVNSSGSLGRPKKDINVQGMMVPAGTSFNEFMYIYLDKEQKKQDTKAGAEQAKTKGYMKYGGQ